MEGADIVIGWVKDRQTYLKASNLADFRTIAPCKAIHHGLGFWIPPWIPDSEYWIPDSKKGWIPNFFCFNAFLRISFSCSNLAILKDVVRMHNKFVFFFGKNVLQFRRGFLV